MMIVVLLAGALSLFSAVAIVVYITLSSPNTPANFLGVRGLRRARAMQSSPLWGQLEPMVRWLGNRIRPLLPETTRYKLDRQITLAGDYWGLQPEEFVALSFFSLCAGTLFGSCYGIVLERGGLYVVLGCAFGTLVPYLKLSGIEQERRKRVQNELPYVIDLLSLGLSAGLDFPGALRQVVDKTSNPDDPLIDELGLILQELQVGKTRKQALQQFAERVPGETVREFVGAIVQAEERGNPLAHVLQIQADSSRQRRSVRAEEAAAKASVKLMLPMLLVFAAVLMLIAGPLALSLGSSFGDSFGN